MFQNNIHVHLFGSNYNTFNKREIQYTLVLEYISEPGERKFFRIILIGIGMQNT